MAESVIFSNINSSNKSIFTLENVQEVGWCGYIHPGNPISDKMTLKETWELVTKGGCYVFTYIKPVLDNSFFEKVNNYIDSLNPKYKSRMYFLWISNLDNLSTESTILIKVNLNSSGDYEVSNDVSVKLKNYGYFSINNRCAIEPNFDSNYFVIKEAFASKITFKNSNIKQVFIPFKGMAIGCFRFDFFINGTEELKEYKLAVKYFYLDNKSDIKILNFDVIDPSNNKQIHFEASLDPINQFNDGKDTLRTYFAFSDETSKLRTYFKTSFGESISLIPSIKYSPSKKDDELPYDIPDQNSAMLVLSRQKNNEVNDNYPTYMTFKGDYHIETDTSISSENLNIDMICGLSGTERVCFQGKSKNHLGDSIRFYPNKPAFSPVFPTKVTSTVNEPIYIRELLNDNYLTSWINIIDGGENDEKPYYISQPESSALYGIEEKKDINEKNIFEYKKIGQLLPQDNIFCFPMVPYSGIKINKDLEISSSDIELFEKQIISVLRKNEVACKSLKNFISDTESFKVTNPYGVIVEIDKRNGNWQSILLAKNGTEELKFNNPHLKLQQAFQTNQLFLVATSNSCLTNAENDFQNQISIGDWKFHIDIGSSKNNYGNYSNVMLLKFCKGKISELAKKITLWNQAEDFNKKDELIIISQWLQNYIEDGVTQSENGNTLFDKFKNIVEDENWNGVLFLKVDIDRIPEQLEGFNIGINKNNFNVHNFGIEINKIDGETMSIKDKSSMFGIINYLADGYDKETKMSSPSLNSDYDFKVNELKVLFESSFIKNFESTAQLTLSKLFGSKVSKMGDGGNLYNSVIFKGNYQNNGEEPVYELRTTNSATFLFDNNVLNKIEISSAQMNTLKSTNGDKIIQFNLRGFIDFKTLKYNETDAIDFLSFDKLKFSNLYLIMNLKNDQIETKTFEFNIKNILFDITGSSIRKGSLYESFALELLGMESGKGKNKDNIQEKDDTPLQKGYLNIITDLRLTGVDDGEWYGLKFRLNMGTPGELAGKVALNSELLIAWSSEGGIKDECKAAIGIHLPGVTNSANLISIQNVLKLSYGPIRLIYAKQGDSKKSFMLMLTDIALKFMGLLKIPPNGNTVFYLWGNPESAGKASGLGWYAMYRKRYKIY